jgi:hypothetical protein
VIVGSIKTNLGHLEAVSGLAGVMKAVLAIEKGVIPPNLNFQRPNPAIDMKAWNVTVSPILSASVRSIAKFLRFPLNRLPGLSSSRAELPSIILDTEVPMRMQFLRRPLFLLLHWANFQMEVQRSEMLTFPVNCHTPQAS